MAIVETRRVIKLFGDVRAVDGIDLVAREGEFLVLLGPSGCGKTTLMRLIAGLERPTSGDIVIDGNIVTGLPLVWSTTSAKKNFQFKDRFNFQVRLDYNNPLKTFCFDPPTTSPDEKWPDGSRPCAHRTGMN